jgi:adenosylhomocysteine nucleosidase
VREALILSGVEPEARFLARALRLVPLPALPFLAFGRDGVRLAAAGVGARRLPERFEPLSDGLQSPLVISAGLCGALAPELRAGDLVVPQAALDAEGRCYVVSHSLTGHERRGMIATVGEAATTPEAKARLLAQTGAMAVDMESAAILAAAARRHWPSIVVRAVSDAAGETLPEEVLRLVDGDGRLQVGQAVRTFAARPGLLRAALQLQRSSRRALGAVADALLSLLSSSAPGNGRAGFESPPGMRGESRK